MPTDENLKGTSVTNYSIRTGGPQPVACGTYGFLIQTFGVEKSVTYNYCSIVDKLKGTANMQAYKEPSTNYPVPDDPENQSNIVNAGPYKSVSYQGKRVIVDMTSGGKGLVFSGTEQFSSIYCDDEEKGIAGQDGDCNSSKVL